MSQSRQLAVIMFTDIVGYTALMDQDESKAVELLKTNRQVQRPIIEKRGGRWLKEIGDGVLASFNTVTDAIYAAGEIQKSCENEPNLKLRIGIHLGEVIFEGEDVFGSGVNIASRLEPLAPIGGILVSDAIHRNISNKREIRSTLIGEKELRGVKEPIKVYQVIVDDFNNNKQIDIGNEQVYVPARTPVKKPKYSRNYIWILLSILLLVLAYFFYDGNKKRQASTSEISANESVLEDAVDLSLAVLPLENYSDEKEKNQFLVDGITEEIINHLSEIESLIVRSRSSTEQYRTNRPSTVEIGEQLFVSHLLEGSVQVIGKEFKVVVQLIDVKNDRHVWHDSYVEPLEDIFEVYNDIAQKVSRELAITLNTEEKQKLAEATTNNSEAYESYLKARDEQTTWGITRHKRHYLNAIENFQKAQRLDPRFIEAMIQRAHLYWEIRMDYPDEIILDSILILSNLAIDINPKSVRAYLSRAEYYKEIGERDSASLDIQKAYHLNPNDGRVNSLLGQEHFDNKNYIFGLQLMHRAERLLNGEPIGRFWLYHELGIMYAELYDKEEALKQWDKMSEIEPNHPLILYSKVYIESPDVALELLNKQGLFDEDEGFVFSTFGRLYTLNKEFKKAIEYYTKARDYQNVLKEANFDRYANEGLALWHNGQKQKGEQLIRNALDGYLNPELKNAFFCDREIRLAAIHAFLGHKSEAYKWLNDSRWTNTAHFEVQHDVWFSNINQEKEFKDIVNSAMLEKKKVREEITRLKAAGEWEI